MTRQEEIELISQSLLPTLSNGEVTLEDIREKVYSRFTDMIAEINGFPVLTEEEKSMMVEDFSVRLLHVRNLHARIFSERYEPWLEAAKPDINFRFWRDYRHYLLETSKFDKDTVDSIDATTDKVLDRCGDPAKRGLGLRKGLVVGNVQSGKTADYIGVITKAADAGYRVIIVLAGLLNSLRSQTQGRIDAGFVGVSKVEVKGANGSGEIEERIVGVGKNAPPRPFSVLSLTTLQSDFTGRTAQTVTATHGVDDKTVYIAVAKKNAGTLKSLIQWFSPAMCSQPMLLVDDEADNASVNYRDYDSPTTINKLIRDLLRKFPRATYLGYTATPFANIFIDPDVVTADHGEDLFPRDFVVALDAPDHYMGPRRIFGSDVSPEDDIVREIFDSDEYLPITHKRTFYLELLPPSLKDALRGYLLSTAIRIARGDAACHSSALINVSRFISVHRRVAMLVRSELSGLKSAIQVYGALPYDRNNEMTELHRLYEQEFAGCGVGWDDVQASLPAAVEPVEVLEIHMEGDARQLNYSREDFPNGRKVVAIGGFSLSRGLTLEGLCMSYLLRNTKMYDTLMQMGRWFGYRRGYGDVCRIHLTGPEREWYCHITAALEELWDEFGEMEKARLTPSQFGLRVRSHPLNLIVTARSKMRNAMELTVQVDLSGRHVEPNVFAVRDLAHNRNVLDRLVSDIGIPDGDPSPCSGYYWKGVSSRRIQSFVRESKRLDVNMDTAADPICRYLENLALEGVDSCDVYLASVEDGEFPCDVAELKIGREEFGIEVKPDGTLVVGGGRKHITGRNQERAGLSDVLGSEQVQNDIAEFLLESSRKNVPGRFYRKYRKRPLLVLHVVNGKLTEGSAVPSADCSEIAVWRLVFPGDSRECAPERLVSYVLNTVAARQYFAETNVDADEVLEEVE
jgi:hypothetical protein